MGRAINRVKDLIDLFEHEHLLTLLSMLAYHLTTSSEEQQRQGHLDRWSIAKLKSNIKSTFVALCPDTNHSTLQPIKAYIDRLNRLE